MRLHLQLMRAAVRAGKPAESQDFWEKENLGLHFPEGRLQREQSHSGKGQAARQALKWEEKKHFQSFFPIVIFCVELGITMEFLGCPTAGTPRPGKHWSSLSQTVEHQYLMWGLLVCFLHFSPWALATEEDFHMEPEELGLSVPLLMVKIRNEP